MGQTKRNSWGSPVGWPTSRSGRKYRYRRRWLVAPESKFDSCDEIAKDWQVGEASDASGTESSQRIKVTLQSVFDRLSALKKIEDVDDEYTLKPKPRAYTEIKLVIMDTFDQMGERFPVPRIVPDGEGGLVADWLNNGKRVRLRFRSDRERRDYIYYQTQDDYDVELPTVEHLVNRLEWLLTA